jgi:CheY-like chemotaxis protein
MERSSHVALLVEDKPSDREQISKMLELAGYNVLLAKDFTEASDYIQSRKDIIAIAIVDLLLGKKESKEGIRLFQPLKDNDIPFIVVSAYADRDDVRKAFLDYGAGDFWFKDTDDIDYFSGALGRVSTAESTRGVNRVLKIVSGLNVALIVTALVAILTYWVGSTALFILTIVAFTVVALLALVIAVPQTRKDVLPLLDKALGALLRFGRQGSYD